MSLIDPTNEPAETGVPPAPRYSSMSSLGGLIPLVLHVSPLDNSPGQDEFFYDPFTRVDSGDFAAARTFFINNGHVVVFHDCPDTMSFQELYPLAKIGYITSLPVQKPLSFAVGMTWGSSPFTLPSLFSRLFSPSFPPFYPQSLVVISTCNFTLHFLCGQVHSLLTFKNLATHRCLPLSRPIPLSMVVISTRRLTAAFVWMALVTYNLANIGCILRQQQIDAEKHIPMNQP